MIFGKGNILGIESSCDDTSAAIIKDGVLLSNVVANQEIHSKYGGVVPEIASREHQKNIVPVVDMAIKNAQISKNEISAIAFTNGPGLMGSLLVGSNFAKAMSMAINCPLIEVNHMEGHIHSLFIKSKKYKNKSLPFPFLCLTVSGGHTQISIVKDFFNITIIGETIDDAAGEAFDKVAKILQLPYPGGPEIDKLAKLGNSKKFNFAIPNVKELNFSFSGFKTSFLYFVQNEIKKNKNFIIENKNDLCASAQRIIIEILIQKLEKAVLYTKINEVAVVGGVAANSELKRQLQLNSWNIHIPQAKYCTDNAAMIAMTGYLKYNDREFVNYDITPFARKK